MSQILEKILVTWLGGLEEVLSSADGTNCTSVDPDRTDHTLMAS